MNARLACLLVLAIPAIYIAQSTQPSEPLTVRVVFGEGDAAPAKWDGGIQASGARIARLELWRAGDEDSVTGANWKLNTQASPPGTELRLGKIAPKGLLVTAENWSPQSRFTISTPNGTFTFTPDLVDSGYLALDGRVRVERVPAVAPLLKADGDQDNPAMALSNGTVYLTYTEFSHSNREQESFAQRKQAPANFDWLSRAAGGDQVKLIRYSVADRKWSAPEAVSPLHEDVMRSTVAVDGKGRVWVIWSANRNGNFDLYARYSDRGRWSNEMRVTRDPGTDVNPVAATDSNGRVWIAWQAYRGTNLDVMAAMQNGDAFAAEQRVSVSPASDWDPAIAAGPRGAIAITWDTYDKGDYDVYARTMRASQSRIEMDAPVAIAASRNFEARSSAAYDRDGRLWVIYETSADQWGKDFGVYDIKGVSLYLGHALAVRCLQGGKLSEPQGGIEAALKYVPGLTGREGPPRMKTTNPGMANTTVQGPRNSFPRIAADPSGRVFLTFRSGAGLHSQIGSIFHQFVTYYSEGGWSRPAEIPHTEGPVDLRPAIVATGSGELLMAAVTDHRAATNGPVGEETTGSGNENLDRALMSVNVHAAPGKPATTFKAVVSQVAGPAPEIVAEREAIATMRSARVQLPGGTYQVMRGEFHRHTEFSADGGADGPLIDAYRYLIDASGMDWGGCCDHDNGGGREYSWWLQQKLTDAYYLGASYVPMFSYERSVRYPEGHRNLIFVQRGVRPLPRLPKTANNSPAAPAPDTQMLYRYLRQYNGVAASHTSGTGMGTDWRDNDPILEPVVEIYQGERQNYEMPGAPRTMTEDNAIGGYQPLGFVSNALKKGFRLGFESSSDHISTHISYCNLWVANRTREGVMEAFRKRRIYGSTDNIVADVRCGPHFMGEEFSVNQPPTIHVHLIGTAPFAKVHIIRDGVEVYSAAPKTKDVNFEWRDAAPQPKGSTSYYYVRGEQADGQLVWASPMWIHL